MFLFGFSRGALLARHFAAWLDKLGLPVAYLGLWDTVDATAGLDVDETCPPNVSAARHAVARDETRKFFCYVPLRSGGAVRVMEQAFPGSHSDVGGLYDDNHLMADLALAWVAAGAKRCGLRLKKGADIAQRLDRSAVSDGTTLKVGTPYVEGAKVTLTVDAVKRGEKVVNFKRKRRKGYRRTVGHRQQLTVATVKAIA